MAPVGGSMVLLVLSGLSCAGGWLLIKSNPQMSAAIWQNGPLSRGELYTCRALGRALLTPQVSGHVAAGA